MFGGEDYSDGFFIKNKKRLLSFNNSLSMF
jgi:hypothetical protein